MAYFLLEFKVKFLTFCCFLSFINFIFEPANSVDPGGISTVQDAVSELH